MYFPSSLVVVSLLASTMAFPLASTMLQQRDLQFRKYVDFQVSDGKAGNALNEVKSKFSINTADLKAVSASDLAIINAARLTAEAAESTFNTQIKAASGDAVAALQNGKIKNKVLKLFLEVSALEIEQAQGASNTAKIAEENKKLTNNINLDKKAAGKASKGVTFTQDVTPKA